MRTRSNATLIRSFRDPTYLLLAVKLQDKRAQISFKRYFSTIAYELSPSSRPPSEPRTDPSSLRLPPCDGAAATIRLARRLNGRDCSHTRPGPRRVAKNKPSPPKIADLMFPIY